MNPVKTILLETNAVNKCIDAKLTGTQISKFLETKHLNPIVNIHSLYELARTFLNPNTRNIGINLFKFLKELNPTFSCMTGELIKREVNKLHYDTSVNFLCNPDFKKQTDEAIKNLSNGNFSWDYEKFIRNREREIQSDQKIWDKLITLNKKNESNLPSYNSYATTYLSINNVQQVKSHIQQHIEEMLSDKAIIKLLTQINSYPALKTLIRVDLYLNYLVISTGNRPSKDKTDDFRHLVDSSYCSSLVTNDTRLTSIAREINPEIEIITLEKLISS